MRIFYLKPVFGVIYSSSTNVSSTARKTVVEPRYTTFSAEAVSQGGQSRQSGLSFLIIASFVHDHVYILYIP